MALDSISNAVYHDTVNVVSKTVEATVINGTLHTQKSVNSKVLDTSTNVKAANSSQGRGQANVSEDQLKDAIDKANKHMKPHRTRFEFNYHEETRRVSITVRDKETSEVIKEIPPEQALEMLEKLWEIAGFLVDEKR
ncbi:MAG: flagellar protein FlaG [Bacteroidales bacterium]|nr:flagellar protein FlaG [Bacteroidales bacterium]